MLVSIVFLVYLFLMLFAQYVKVTELVKVLDIYGFLRFGRSGGCGRDLHAIRTVECCK